MNNKSNLTVAEKREYRIVQGFTVTFHIAFFLFAYFALQTPSAEKQQRSNQSSIHKMP